MLGPLTPFSRSPALNTQQKMQTVPSKAVQPPKSNSNAPNHNLISDSATLSGNSRAAVIVEKSPTGPENVPTPSPAKPKAENGSTASATAPLVQLEDQMSSTAEHQPGIDGFLAKLAAPESDRAPNPGAGSELSKDLASVLGQSEGTTTVYGAYQKTGKEFEPFKPVEVKEPEPAQNRRIQRVDQFNMVQNQFQALDLEEMGEYFESLIRENGSNVGGFSSLGDHDLGSGVRLLQGVARGNRVYAVTQQGDNPARTFDLTREADGKITRSYHYRQEWPDEFHTIASVENPAAGTVVVAHSSKSAASFSSEARLR